MKFPLNPFAGVRRRNTKESAMSDKETPATPGTTAQQVDVEAIKQAAIEAATAAVTAAVAPLAEQVKGLQEAQAKTATPEAITKAVNDAIAAQTASQGKTADRAKFIAENLKDIPDAFHSHIGDDPAKWTDQAKSLRAALKSAGAKVADPAGDAAAARQTLIEKAIKEKLGGNTELGALLSGATEQEINTQADALASTFKKTNPDFGVVKDGGETPNDRAADAELGSGGFLQMPGAAAVPTPTPAPASATA